DDDDDDEYSLEARLARLSKKAKKALKCGLWDEFKDLALSYRAIVGQMEAAKLDLPVSPRPNREVAEKRDLTFTSVLDPGLSRFINIWDLKDVFSVIGPPPKVEVEHLSTKAPTSDGSLKNAIWFSGLNGDGSSLWGKNLPWLRSYFSLPREV
ncbi:MAG: hypothetical protein LBE31_08305, partial [Deltaproteobacteria bacterium]|nr:hypothetical protein [Deltaproteobacteria bacterium]